MSAKTCACVLVMLAVAGTAQAGAAASARIETVSGSVLTVGAKEKPTMGKVVAVGGGREDDDGKAVKPSVEVGSTVLYQRYSGAEFEGPNDKQYIVVRDADILATMA